MRRDHTAVRLFRCFQGIKIKKIVKRVCLNLPVAIGKHIYLQVKKCATVPN
jgi:hypothetical protein